MGNLKWKDVPTRTIDVGGLRFAYQMKMKGQR